MPGNLNTGVVRIEGEVEGGAALIRVEIYYDPASPLPTSRPGRCRGWTVRASPSRSR